MSYRVEGHFIEACDCNAICPCWIDDEPDEGECTGMFLWDITSGAIDGTVVSGLRVASVSYHTGKRHGAQQRVVMLIDEEADEGQSQALERVFSGKAGGPLAELAEMLGELAGVERAPITLTWSARGAKIAVGDGLEASTETIKGETGRPIVLGDSAMAIVLGSPAQVGHALSLRIDVPEGKLKKEAKGTSATSGIFTYAG